jgi:hypothetical protein
LAAEECRPGGASSPIPNTTLARAPRRWRLCERMCARTGAGGSLLEKKWTAIVRLQKRVMELEERLASEAPPPLPPASGGAAPGGGVAPAAPLRASGASARAGTSHTRALTCVLCRECAVLAPRAAEAVLSRAPDGGVCKPRAGGRLEHGRPRSVCVTRVCAVRCMAPFV